MARRTAGPTGSRANAGPVRTLGRPDSLTVITAYLVAPVWKRCPSVKRRLSPSWLRSCGSPQLLIVAGFFQGRLVNELITEAGGWLDVVIIVCVCVCVCSFSICLSGWKTDVGLGEKMFTRHFGPVLVLFGFRYLRRQSQDLFS